jgi:branched-chain amino acid transport system permease protein
MNATIEHSKYRQISFWIVIAFFLLCPVIAAKEPYILHILIIVVIYTTLVWGLDLLLDCALISCAQIAFWGIGSYTFALLTLKCGWNPWVALISAGIVPAIISALLSYSSVNLKTMYWCLFSLVFAVAFHEILFVWRTFLGGAEGIRGIPKLPLITSRAEWYYLAYLLLLLIGGVIYQLRQSRIGLILRGVRISEELARSTGISIIRCRLLCLVLANFFAGIMGGFYAAYTGALSPFNLELDAMFFLYVYLIVGGKGSLGGCLAGTALLIFIRELLGPFGMYVPIVYGTIVIIFVTLIPGGLVSLPGRLLGYFEQVQTQR